MALDTRVGVFYFPPWAAEQLENLLVELRLV